MAMLRRQIATLLATIVLAGCSRQPALFSESNARAHVGMLAGTIGNRPVGTPANDRARAYIIEQLKLFGFDVRVQEADARRAELGRTARVANIIATRPGARTEALALVSHYDSAPDAPGAADDGLGVAVSLEAARVLAARSQRQWTLAVLVTDGEEAGLMGAAALVNDPEVRNRLRAYLNLEAAGSARPALLFEAGPGNSWLVRPWARRAPHPRGGSYALEVYQRLPNDTDFSILKRHDVPGLNFGSVGDSYTYHTARDTPERLSPQLVREFGENVVTIAETLDGLDITKRTGADATYFDIGGAAGLTYGPQVSWILALLALFLGAVAWVRITAVALRLVGGTRWLLTALWSVVALAIVVSAMIGATWALRAAREVYHPWYARPDRFFMMLAAVGIAAGWSIARLGRWLPTRMHGVRYPLVTWSLALPLWLALASAALWFAPAAAYLWVLPLFVAGALLSVVPAGNTAAVRAVSMVILVVTAALWLRDTVELLRFAVAVFGRLPIVTPVFVYAAILAMTALMIVPPLAALVTTARPLLRPSLVTAVLLLSVVVAASMAYAAPAYTREQPLRRVVRAVQEADGGSATWEVASVEPGIDLEAGAPAGWAPARTAPPATVPWGRLPHPFVFRTSGPALGPPPAVVTRLEVQPVEGGTDLSVAVMPREPGLTAAFVLPPGLTPARSNLPGLPRLGRWTAVYVALPAAGVEFHASFRDATPERLRDLRVAVTSHGFPGGAGWQRLPAWLPQERAVWSAAATWIVPAGAAPGIEPVPPLR
jgi:hypothetical protein